MVYSAPTYVTVSGLDGDALIFDRNRDQLDLDTKNTDAAYASPNVTEKCDFTAGAGTFTETWLSVEATQTCESEDLKLGEKSVITENLHFVGGTR